MIFSHDLAFIIICNKLYYAIADMCIIKYLDCRLCCRTLTNTETIRAVTATPNNDDRITVSIMLSFELLPFEQLQINTINNLLYGYHITYVM